MCHRPPGGYPTRHGSSPGMSTSQCDLAQHDHARSSYADMDVDDRTSLSTDEVVRLRAGEDMGMALPAELDGWPGPRRYLTTSRSSLDPM